jgi:hypothetical protein
MTCDDIIKLTIPIITSGAIAWYAARRGFVLACRRDDRATIQSAAVKLALLDEKLVVTAEQDIAVLHERSIQDICPEVIRAIYVLRGEKKRAAQRAWEIYRELRPSQYDQKKLSTEICAFQAAHCGFRFQKEDLFTPKEAMTRILKALQHAMS